MSKVIKVRKNGITREQIAAFIGKYRDTHQGSRNRNLPTSIMDADTNRAWLRVAFDAPRKTYPMPVAHWKALGMG